MKRQNEKRFYIQQTYERFKNIQKWTLKKTQQKKKKTKKRKKEKKKTRQKQFFKS